MTSLRDDSLYPDSPRYDVFVSHSSKNRDVAKAIADDFERHGIRCWYAPRNIRPGHDWPTAITEGIEESRMLVLVYTRDSNSSEAVSKEVNYAFSVGRAIVPFKLSDERVCDDLKLPLAGVNWLEGGGGSLERDVSALRGEVAMMLESVTPRSLPETNAPAQITTGADMVEKGNKDPVDGSLQAKATLGGNGSSEASIGWRKVLITSVTICAAVVLALICSILTPKPVPVVVGGTLRSDSCTNLGDDDAQKHKVFGSRYSREEIVSISFESSLPRDRKDEGFDVSQSGDGSVRAWFEERDDGGIDLLVAADGPVDAPQDCTQLFKGYANMKSLSFGDTFSTSKSTNLCAMFSGCSSLKSLDVSGFDTSRATSMQEMFNGCSSLESLDVSGFKTPAVTNLSYMFNGCSSLESLDISGFDTSKAETMRTMFQLCSSLKSLDISGFDTSTATDLGYMFYKCSSLTALDVSGFDTSKATDMCAMFGGCSSLKSLEISGFKTSAVTDMSWTFTSCAGLTSLDLTGWDVSHLVEFEGMFGAAKEVLEVRYPKGDAAWEALVARDDLKGTPRFVAV